MFARRAVLAAKAVGGGSSSSAAMRLTASRAFVSANVSQSSQQDFNGKALLLMALGGALALGFSYKTAECREAAEVKPQQQQQQQQQQPRAPHKPTVTTAGEATSNNANGMKIFTGNANPRLAEDIANHLGRSLGKINVSHFADGEVNVVVNENVRGKDVYIIQPTSPPVNEQLMELLLMISTMRRASARKITAIIPYYGYARQDRKMQARVPISAADVARLLEAMGVDRVVAVDLHCGQIQGFFGPRVPVDNLDGGTVGVSYFGDMDLVNPVIVSPDAGGVYRAKKFREDLSKKHDVEAGLAMIVKQRAKANQIESMDLVGCVDGCDAIIGK
jgi:ribose-phosphate pyrophosphokinase